MKEDGHVAPAVLITEIRYAISSVKNRTAPGLESIDKVSSFYNDVKRSVRQRDTISPKLFAATLDNVIPALEWDNMRVEIDARQLQHLGCADDVVFITTSINQTERMLVDFDKAFGKTCLQRCS
ncbi:unnamed protein product [Angiostrongylus costaricensis]|uniref:Reverse transcriptase domain-containing protein n=1 Tax=Angiostrongylus costaricensis TaxID=334426 RepID=A0A0R3PGV8_ANGCS|nr:unnamed protein product [Angiostrongylus costaricensis]